MATKIFNTRIINKHDLEINWIKATNFTPEKGELIVYDIEVDADGNTLMQDGTPLVPVGRTFAYTHERCKIGDGIHNVNDLPFAYSIIAEEVKDYINTSFLGGEW